MTVVCQNSRVGDLGAPIDAESRSIWSEFLMGSGEAADF